MNVRCLLLCFVVIVSLSIFYPHNGDLVFGTQCSGRSIQGNLDLADTAFLGNVLSIQYIPFSDVAKVIFDVQHVFKGDVGEKITIHYDLGPMFSERITFVNGVSFVVLPEENDGQHQVSFCTPVYYAVPTITNGFFELEKNPDASFGKHVPWTLYEELSPEDIKKIEELQKKGFVILQQNMTDVKQLEKNLMFIIGILVILVIIGGIITVVVFLWRKRT